MKIHYTRRQSEQIRLGLYKLINELSKEGYHLRTYSKKRYNEILLKYDKDILFLGYDLNIDKDEHTIYISIYDILHREFEIYHMYMDSNSLNKDFEYTEYNEEYK